jgi:hypothetical protein
VTRVGPEESTEIEEIRSVHSRYRFLIDASPPFKLLIPAIDSEPENIKPFGNVSLKQFQKQNS